MKNDVKILKLSTGEEVIAPVQVFNCGNCGEILPLGDTDELI